MIKSKNWKILLAICLTFLILGASAAFAATNENIRSIFLGTFQKNPFKKQSQIHASLIDSKLNLNFDLIDEDKPKFQTFIKNWFGTEEESSLPAEVKTLSLGIDENLKNILSTNTPVNLKLNVSEKSLSFNSNIISGLQNPLIKSDFEFATGSSKLNVEYSDASKYQLKLENPEDLANYATRSGSLTASTKLEGLFKSLPKVATIELSVNGKNISGKIVLK